MAGSGETLTYGDLDAGANRLSHVLRNLGLKPGDHVAICLENHPRFFEVVWGCHYAGIVYTCCSSRLTTEELSYIINDCGAKVFITSKYKAEQAEEIVAATPNLVARFMLDGTTTHYDSYESTVSEQPSTPLAERFEGDRSKFLAFLRSKGQTIRDYRREVEENIIFQYMQGQQRKSQSIISPVRIETYYNENKDRFYREDEVHLRLIQITRTDTETDATLTEQGKMILARFRAGEKFEDLAKQFSKDLKRSKGGDWGWNKRSDFRKEFSEAAFNLKKGEASEPILLPEGAFVLYAEDRRFAGIQPLDEVRDQIERVLVQQMGRAAQERWLERLRRNGYVKYH